MFATTPALQPFMLSALFLTEKKIFLTVSEDFLMLEVIASLDLLTALAFVSGIGIIIVGIALALKGTEIAVRAIGLVDTNDPYYGSDIPPEDRIYDEEANAREFYESDYYKSLQDRDR